MCDCASKGLVESARLRKQDNVWVGWGFHTMCACILQYGEDDDHDDGVHENGGW